MIGRAPLDADDGFTLTEVVVSMMVMTIFLAMFTTGVLQMFRAANNNEAVSTSQSQLSITFSRLDKEIRYATDISAPGKVGANSYVEYLTTNSGTPVCTELRMNVATARLQLRTWKQGSAPGGGITLASNVSATAPFTLYPADSTFNFQRLGLRLVANTPSGTTVLPRQTDVTFTALNTSLEVSTTTVCDEGRTAAWPG